MALREPYPIQVAPTTCRPWESRIAEFLERRDDREKWDSPPATSDILIDTTDGTGPPIAHPCDSLRRSGQPRVFRGRIGTGNVVQADPRRRDALRDRDGIRALEMEGCGIADASWFANIGYLVVRGTCDYCNSTKNDDWHYYAALIAAAYTRTVIEYLHPIAVPISGPGYHLPIPETSRLIEHDTCATMRRDISALGLGPTAREPGTSVNMSSSTARQVDLGQAEEALTAGTVTLRDQDSHTVLRGLNSQLRGLIEDYRWSEVPAVAAELEKYLRLLPQCGNAVREAWLLLTRVETHRLLSDREAGREVDVSRLRALRQEAENVVD